MPPTSTGAAARRDEVRRQVAAGDVAGLRELAARLEAEGVTVTPDVLRADLRALGVVRVERGEASVLAIPVDGPAPKGPGTVTERLAAEVSSDPDWPIQLGVAAVVAVFVLVGLLGWLISA